MGCQATWCSCPSPILTWANALKEPPNKFTGASYSLSQWCPLVHGCRRVPRTVTQRGKPVLHGASPPDHSGFGGVPPHTPSFENSLVQRDGLLKTQLLCQLGSPPERMRCCLKGVGMFFDTEQSMVPPPHSQITRGWKLRGGSHSSHCEAPQVSSGHAAPQPGCLESCKFGVLGSRGGGLPGGQAPVPGRQAARPDASAPRIRAKGNLATGLTSGKHILFLS